MKRYLVFGLVGLLSFGGSGRAGTRDEAAGELSRTGWIDDCTGAANWSGMDAAVGTDEDGLRIKQTGTAGYGKAISRAITLNVDEYSRLEISLSAVDPETRWSVLAFPFGGLKLEGDKPGEYSCNLKEITGWSGVKTFQLALYVIGKNKAIWIRRVRLVRSAPPAASPVVRDIAPGGSFWLDERSKYSTGAGADRKTMAALQTPFLTVAQEVGATAGYLTALTATDRAGLTFFSTSFFDGWGRAGDANKLGYYAIPGGGAQGALNEGVMKEYGGVFFQDQQTGRWSVWRQGTTGAAAPAYGPLFRWKYIFACGDEESSSITMEISARDPVLTMSVETVARTPYTYSIPFTLSPKTCVSTRMSSGPWKTLVLDQEKPLVLAKGNAQAFFFHDRKAGDRVVFLVLKTDGEKPALSYTPGNGRGLLTVLAPDTGRTRIFLAAGVSGLCDTSSWDSPETANPGTTSLGWWDETLARYTAGLLEN